MCIDHLTAPLVRLARRRTPSRLHKADGSLHVIAKGASFEDLAGAAFGPLAGHAASKTAVASLARAARAIERAAPPRRRPVMRPYLDAIERARRSAARTD